MAVKYSFENFNKESMAKASAQNLSISLKKSVELNNAIRGKKVKVAVAYLENVIEKKAVVPYRKYRAEVAHQRGKGIDTGGFPVNVAKETLRVLKSALKNAKEKELSEESLYLVAISSRKGVNRFSLSRYMGRKMKSTNLEVVVGVREKNSKKTSKVEAKKE